MDTNSPTQNLNSAFSEFGIAAVIQDLLKEIQTLYLEDEIPWVVGYSGGKDSTAVLQLVWMAVEALPSDTRRKPIHVISTDTLVENPVVARWVSQSLTAIESRSQLLRLPFQAHRLTPEVNDSFWVNLIGRGYPAPRHKFRWCTERLKIKPSNKFITDVVQDNGEAILVLGTRKAESSGRAARMTRMEKGRVRDRLSPNTSLPNSLVYSPIESWSNDDVWLFLMQYRNPWKYSNEDLLSMYRGATEGGECPLVVDTSTPSCGSSRFGCWVCTLVEEDKSMAAMINNDDEKEWMAPLLDLRNELDLKDDRHLRDFRRMAGHVQLYYDRPIPGPYTQEVRAGWLRKLLEAQKWIRENGPEHAHEIELITVKELEEIRRLWVVDKHEIEDLLPEIYEEVMGVEFPGKPIEHNHFFGNREMKVLREVCEGDDLHFQLIRELLDLQANYRSYVRRAGLFSALERAFKRSAFDGIEDATKRARLKQRALVAAEEGEEELVNQFLKQLFEDPECRVEGLGPGEQSHDS